jgi:glyceraldehyde-3-phosphate dehydrogenase (NADP+)
LFKPAKHGVLLISPLLEAFRNSFPSELLILFMVEVEWLLYYEIRKSSGFALIGNSTSAIALQDQHT